MSYLNGPWRFRLMRRTDASGVSGVGHVADGCAFSDGTCALRWRSHFKSTAVYASLEDLVAIHGHDGATVIEWMDERPTQAVLRGADDCAQDAMENCPFASIGGLLSRGKPECPHYVTQAHRDEYIRGYEAAAEGMYGKDWRTCEFAWTLALTIPSESGKDQPNE